MESEQVMRLDQLTAEQRATLRAELDRLDGVGSDGIDWFLDDGRASREMSLRLFDGVQTGSLDPRTGQVILDNRNRLAADAASADGSILLGARPVEFTAIGIGKPLKISLEQVYVGADRSSAGDLLITSRAKGTADADAATVAMNWLGEGISPQEIVPLDDAKAGTDILYYSPSETNGLIELAVNLKFDQFDRAQWKAWLDATANLGALPVMIGGFLGGGPGGAAGGQALVGVATAGADLAIELLDRRFDGNGGIDMTMTVAIYRPGVLRGEPGFVLLTPSNFVTEVIMEDGFSLYRDGRDDFMYMPTTRKVFFDVDGAEFYVDNRDRTLRHLKDGEWGSGPGWAYRQGEEVRGPWPYVLVSLDGAEDESLTQWKPAVVAADLAAKFLNRGSDTDVPNLSAKVFTAWFDTTMVTRANSLSGDVSRVDRKIKKLEEDHGGTEKEKKEREKEIADLREKRRLYEKQREAAIESIQSENLQRLIRGEDEPEDSDGEAGGEAASQAGGDDANSEVNAADASSSQSTPTPSSDDESAEEAEVRDHPGGEQNVYPHQPS